MRRSYSKLSAGLFALLTMAAVAAGACTGDPPVGAGSSGTVDGGADLSDGGGGEELDGGAVSDAGPLDLGDGGADSEDSGGGTCNTQSRTGVPRAISTCNTITSRLTGGALVAGTYELSAVTVYQTSCTGFKSTDHYGRLQLTKVDPVTGAAAAEHNEFYRATGVLLGFATVRNFDLKPNLKTQSPAVETITCGKSLGDTAVSYASFFDRLGGKQKLVIVRPFSGATARFEWTKVR
jgi:hypothetical protein